jgi:hypothetical protein
MLNMYLETLINFSLKVIKKKGVRLWVLESSVKSRPTQF